MKNVLRQIIVCTGTQNRECEIVSGVTKTFSNAFLYQLRPKGGAGVSRSAAFWAEGPTKAKLLKQEKVESILGAEGSLLCLRTEAGKGRE